MLKEKVDIKLIRLVKRNPLLYDSKNPKYMDSNAKEVAWQQIGDELKKPAADCKVRWVNIRDVYRRMLRKSLSNPNQPSKSYKYEAELAFMRRYYRDGVLPNYEPDDYNDSDNNTQEEAIEERLGTSDSEESEPVRKTNNKRMKNSKKKKRLVRMQAETDAPVESDNLELNPADPVDAFVLSIGATLKTFSPYHLNLAKSKIFSVVQEHDLQQIVQRQRHDEQPNERQVTKTETVYIQ